MNKNENIGRVSVQPIRDINTLNNCINYFHFKWENSNGKNKPIHYRNYMLFLFGINTALRISDILRVKVHDVKDGYLTIREKKTNKINHLQINNKLLIKIKQYIKVQDLKDNDFLFFSQKGINKPTTRINVYRILNNMKTSLRLAYPIGTHTMRKTFGFHYYQKTKNWVVLSKMLNHSDKNTTLIYIGVLQEQVDNERVKFFLGGRN